MQDGRCYLKIMFLKNRLTFGVLVFLPLHFFLVFLLLVCMMLGSCFHNDPDYYIVVRKDFQMGRRERAEIDNIYITPWIYYG